MSLPRATIGPRHDGKGTPVTVQKIPGERDFAENGQGTGGRFELLLREQIRARLPCVDVLLRIRQAELKLAILEHDVAQCRPKLRIQLIEIKIICQDQSRSVGDQIVKVDELTIGISTGLRGR
jgi:hypothetical protein